ncbi:hypothetical protein Bccel_2695 [Pseudobacteroides cellulosolvens ATCC 35603 = DSM 2933]|uniref:Uncharacterized protein n=1 Tax=Pseudobacteroides cellulosolvens ATCC 35603 = DSM 2933 TaxID=398512 RepID=A0A0L6JNR8_9FIRM|nr:hypothetical protein Bccel_2695 [Pseudobacteroides cellulosolvens ATCC 35603 = DSM 2933]
MVTPHAGVWIETLSNHHPAYSIAVTPHAGVWIETTGDMVVNEDRRVTPHAGVWIETKWVGRKYKRSKVTPHAGVWIETLTFPDQVLFHHSSRLMQACGLKQALYYSSLFYLRHASCRRVD